MPIINSTYIIDETPQADGRRWVKEVHTDQSGNKYYAEYLADENFDYETCMNQRAAIISADIDRKESALNEGSTGINYRKIRQDAFLDRFTFNEQLRIQQSTDPVIKVFVQNAISVRRPYINLDHGLVQQALPYLVQTEILDGETLEERQARATQILQTGTLEEI